ncbi:MAG: hypothetical protein IJ093_03835 [Bacilli bacterium]|nr:hypothetical protein [Bacilli bacterium]
MKNNSINNGFKPKSKWLKVASIIVVAVSLLIVAVAVFMFINSIIGFMTPNEQGSWDGLTDFLLLIGSGYLVTMTFPSLVAGILGIRYSKGKSKLNTCLIWAIVAIIVYLFNIFSFAYYPGAFTSFSLDYSPTYERSKFIVMTMIIMCLPLVLYLIGIYKEEFEKGYFKNFCFNHKWVFAVIGILLCLLVGYLLFKTMPYRASTKIDVNESKLPTLGDFVLELKDRGFVYELPEEMKDLTEINEISVELKNYEYSVNFSIASANEAQNKNKKFPLYVYDGYASLIEKSPSTAKYYTKGPEDWWISWHIYSVNGQIYAAIGNESELGKSWQTDLFKTKYSTIVSEKSKITTYNRVKNQFYYGGCIKDVNSTTQKVSLPETIDYTDSSCTKITVVDRVDAETLDKISKELSPRYWLEYSH